MSWMKNRAVAMALAAMLAWASAWGTKSILAQKDKVYTYQGITFTVPDSVIAQGTNQVALWTIKLKAKIDEM